MNYKVKAYNITERGVRRALYIDAHISEDNSVLTRLRKTTGLKNNLENLNFLNKCGAEILRDYINTLNNINDFKRKDFKSLIKNERVRYEKENKYSFKNAVEKYFKENGILKKSTLISLRQRLSPAIKYFNNSDIRDINAESINNFFVFLDGKISSPLRKICMAKALNFILNHFYNNGRINHILINIPKRWKVDGRPRIKTFKLNEIQTILQEKNTSEIILYLKIGLLCGARMGEILALQWKDVDFDLKKIDISKAVSEKNGEISTCKTISSHRLIDCVGPLLEALKEFKEQKKPHEDDFIFQGQRKPFIKNFHNSYLKEQYLSLLERLKIDYIPIYNARHSFASLMLSKGENVMWVSWMLGHSSMQITLNYYSRFLNSGENRAEFLNDFIKRK